MTSWPTAPEAPHPRRACRRSSRVAGSGPAWSHRTGG